MSRRSRILAVTQTILATEESTSMSSWLDYTAMRVAVDRGVARVTIDNPPLNLLDAVLMTDSNAL